MGIISNIYWIRKPGDTDITKQGYVGVARNIGERISRHLRESNSNTHVNKKLEQVLLEGTYEVICHFTGDESICYDIESQLRPNYHIGLNIVPGGHGGSTSLGIKMPRSHSEKNSLRMLGNKLGSGNKGKPKSEKHKQNIGKSNTGKPKSLEQKQKQSESMTGRKQSPEHIEKKRLSALGKKRGPYKKSKKNDLVL